MSILLMLIIITLGVLFAPLWLYLIWYTLCLTVGIVVTIWEWLCK